MLQCDRHFPKALVGMISAFLFQSYLLSLVIDGTERYKWLEEILSDFSSFGHKETTLVNDPILPKYAVYKYVQTPETKHVKKRNIEILAQNKEKW